jgi:hypothetical protein
LPFGRFYLGLFMSSLTVLDPGEGVCADPRRGAAILGIGGPGLPKGDDEHHLSPDRGGEKT